MFQSILKFFLTNHEQQHGVLSGPPGHHMHPRAGNATTHLAHLAYLSFFVGLGVACLRNP